MDRRIRALPRASERHQQQQQRFLRPGALARLRDSRIVARSVRSLASLLLVPRPAAPPSPARPVALAADQHDAAPRFLGTTTGYGRYPLRRRVAAARGVAFFSPPSP